MLDTIKASWDIRSSWWPVYQFTSQHYIDTMSECCLYHKSICSLVLLGPGLLLCDGHVLQILAFHKTHCLVQLLSFVYFSNISLSTFSQMLSSEYIMFHTVALLYHFFVMRRFVSLAVPCLKYSLCT